MDTTGAGCGGGMGTRMLSGLQSEAAKSGTVRPAALGSWGGSGTEDGGRLTQDEPRDDEFGLYFQPRKWSQARVRELG